MEVLIKILDNKAVIPFKKHPDGDACYDLIATSCKYDSKYDRFIYGIGFSTELPPYWEAQIRPRSTNTKTDFYMPNSPSTIDSNYRGEWLVVYKHRVPFNMLFPAGDPILNIYTMQKLAPYKIGEAVAQVKFSKVPSVEWKISEIISETSRGVDGGLIRK